MFQNALMKRGSSVCKHVRISMWKEPKWQNTVFKPLSRPVVDRRYDAKLRVISGL